MTTMIVVAPHVVTGGLLLVLLVVERRQNGPHRRGGLTAGSVKACALPGSAAEPAHRMGLVLLAVALVLPALVRWAS